MKRIVMFGWLAAIGIAVLAVSTVFSSEVKEGEETQCLGFTRYVWKCVGMV